MNRFDLFASDGKRIQCYRWQPDEPIKATVQIAHGMGEHARRYDAVAKRLTAAGYAVFANDYRGHGDTDPDALGDMGHDGWNRAVADAYELHAHAASAVPGVKRVLLGHSMGASLVQQFLYRHGAVLDAAVLSGSPGFAPAVQSRINRAVTGFERLRLGSRANSALLQRLLFARANKAFARDAATGFEWLSRDAQAVARYTEDPQCGFVLRTGSLEAFLAGAATAAGKPAVDRIPKRLPIYIFSGSDDPVHDNAKNLQRLTTAYRQAGIWQLDYKLYPGGRHEMLNETNRDEVVTDLINWLDTHV